MPTLWRGGEGVTIPARRGARRPMSTREALLRAVIDDPEDDAARLVYADWLDEHGEGERAEALRLGVRRRHLDDLDPEAWAIDWRRERALERHREEWEKDLPAFEGVTWEVSPSGLAEGV